MIFFQGHSYFPLLISTKRFVVVARKPFLEIMQKLHNGEIK